MAKTEKLYEGTEYVSHIIEKVDLRRAPTLRWFVDIKTKKPKGMADMPFSGFFDVPVDAKAATKKAAIERFVKGMRDRWVKRTSKSADWLDTLKADLEKTVDAG